MPVISGNRLLSSKVFTSILNARLTEWAEENTVFAEAQTGFRKDYSATDHIQTTKCVITSIRWPVAMKTIQHGRQTQLIKKLIILKSLHADFFFLFSFFFLFLITVSANLMLSSVLLRNLWLWCFSFILLDHLHFLLVKRIPIIFQISIQLKQISPSTNRFVKVKINTYTNTI